MKQAEPFGTDQPDAEVTYSTIARQLREMETRALTPGSHDDVLTLIEFLRSETVKGVDALEESRLALKIREQALNVRQAGLDQREREINTKQRAVAAVLTRGTAKRGWRLRG